MLKVQIHQLELVYPPISNQEAEWLVDNEDVEEQISKSQLYFICQKLVSEFSYPDNVIELIEERSIIDFTIYDNEKSTPGSIDLSELQRFHHTKTTNFTCELGEKLIRVWIEDGDQRELLDWFTPDKLIFDFSRNPNSFIRGLSKYRDFLSYHLHYIGISKSRDSFQRLIANPHEKRLRILSNEFAFASSTRLSDELFFLFFDIDSLEINTFLGDEFEGFGMHELGDKSKIIADAEKAFVRIMSSKYNKVKYKEFPFSTDGLYSSKVDSYAFIINEDTELLTANESIRGQRKNMPSTSENYKDISDSDFIQINKGTGEVTLFRKSVPCE